VQEVNGVQSQGLMDEPKHFAIYFVLSDFGATHSVSILQGLDTSFPYVLFNYFEGPLRALADPTSPKHDPAYAAALDQSVARILYQIERFGLLDCASPAGPLANCSLAPRPALNKSEGITLSEQLAEKAAV
jgi:beta-glucosidase